MTTEEKAAFLRAAADGASVTQADKNQIFGRPRPDEEDRLCQEKVGMTMEELRRKTMSDSETLTELECDILRFDATYEWNGFNYCRHPIQVFALLANDDDDEISRRANLGAKGFEGAKRERREKERREEEAEEEAKWLKEFKEIVKTSPHFNPPPTRLSPEEKALYLRIIADPASVTRADKNQVFERPPPDEEDRLCKEKVGITMEELRHKVLSNPDTLTEDECDIMCLGVAKRNKSNHKDDRKLSDQVLDIVSTQQDIEIQRRSWDRRATFDQVRTEQRKNRRQQLIAERAAIWYAPMARWVKHMFDANLSRWGLVIFRTAYGEGSDDKWALFQKIYDQHTSKQLRCCWDKAIRLLASHNPLLGEIPAGIATDCFLVADQAVIDDPNLTSKTPYYKPKGPGEADPWQFTITVRAINPDYGASVPMPSEGDLAGYEGEIAIPLPKVADWLYYSFFAKSEDWETRYKLVKGGPAEIMHRSSPYPAYRPGTEPDNLSEILPPETTS
ncbi:hypothetical protein ACQKWADRAFT_321683 [Trichoderma austrokoningii]